MRIVVEIKGGVVYGVWADGEVEVHILDHDVGKCGEIDAQVDVLEVERILQQEVQYG